MSDWLEVGGRGEGQLAHLDNSLIANGHVMIVLRSKDYQNGITGNWDNLMNFLLVFERKNC